MKKTVVKILAAAMAASMMISSFAACSGGTTTSSAASTESSAASTESSAAESTAAESTSGSDLGDIVVISREDGSGTRGAFTELFELEDADKNDLTTTNAQITNSTGVMMTTVAGNEAAMGYISLGSLDDSVKALQIDGVDATTDNIKAGTYKVSRPFNIATLGETTNETAKDFMDYIDSEEGQAIINGDGYIGVSEDAQPYAGTKPEGKVTIAGSSSVSPVMEALVEAYKEINPNATIEIQTSDSTTGMNSAADGICDIGMASRELKDSETEKGLVSKTIAMDGIAVIVNNSNPIENITSAAVTSIYTGETTAWGDIEG